MNHPLFKNKPIYFTGEDLIAAVRRLHHWSENDGPTTFYCKLFDCLVRADEVNFEKFRAGFAAECHALERWRKARNENQFFKEFGINVKAR